MQIKVLTHHEGRPGASFSLVIGDKTIPYRLSVHAAERLVVALTAALAAHHEPRD